MEDLTLMLLTGGGAFYDAFSKSAQQSEDRDMFDSVLHPGEKNIIRDLISLAEVRNRIVSSLRIHRSKTYSTSLRAVRIIFETVESILSEYLEFVELLENAEIGFSISSSIISQKAEIQEWISKLLYIEKVIKLCEKNDSKLMRDELGYLMISRVEFQRDFAIKLCRQLDLDLFSVFQEYILRLQETHLSKSTSMFVADGYSLDSFLDPASSVKMSQITDILKSFPLSKNRAACLEATTYFENKVIEIFKKVDTPLDKPLLDDVVDEIFNLVLCSFVQPFFTDHGTENIFHFTCDYISKLVELITDIYGPTFGFNFSFQGILKRAYRDIEDLKSGNGTESLSSVLEVWENSVNSMSNKLRSLVIGPQASFSIRYKWPYTLLNDKILDTVLVDIFSIQLLINIILKVLKGLYIGRSKQKQSHYQMQLWYQVASVYSFTFKIVSYFVYYVPKAVGKTLVDSFSDQRNVISRADSFREAFKQTHVLSYGDSDIFYGLLFDFYQRIMVLANRINDHEGTAKLLCARDEMNENSAPKDMSAINDSMAALIGFFREQDDKFSSSLLNMSLIDWLES